MIQDIRPCYIASIRINYWPQKQSVIKMVNIPHEIVLSHNRCGARSLCAWGRIAISGSGLRGFEARSLPNATVKARDCPCWNFEIVGEIFRLHANFLRNSMRYENKRRTILCLWLIRGVIKLGRKCLRISYGNCTYLIEAEMKLICRLTPALHETFIFMH